MDIEGEVAKVGFLVYMHRLEASLKKRPYAIISFVEIHRIAGPQFFHKSNDAAVSHLFYEYMVVIGHETEAMDFYQRYALYDIRRLNLRILRGGGRFTF